MAEIKTTGIVIKKTDLGEADRLLTVLSSDLGKVKVVGKGIRRPKAKLSAWLDMFRYNHLTLAKGKTFYIATGAQTEELLLKEGMDWDRLAVGYYLCELLDKNVEEHQELPGLFELLRESLMDLGQGEVSELLIRASFELKFLELLGVSPELERCVVTEAELNVEQQYFFSMRMGGVVSQEGIHRDDFARQVGVNEIKMMRVLRQYPVTAVAKIKVESEVIEKTALCISDFVAHVLEARTKSMKVSEAIA
ncbi:MAG: DNA repair protein RecO [Patescibacteria group bacterium]